MTPGLRALSVCLTFLAGYVDAIGYLRLGGPFVSFMSGNSTQVGVGVGRGTGVGVLAAVLLLFVAGVVAGSLLRRLPLLQLGGRPGVLVLGVVSGLLLLSCVLPREGRLPWALVAATVAMGAVNEVFEHGGVRVGVTYVTGTLVRVAEGVAAALSGGTRWGWVGDALLWAGLVVGAGVGGVMYGAVELGALWGAVGVSGAVVVGAWWVEKPPFGLR